MFDKFKYLFVPKPVDHNLKAANELHEAKLDLLNAHKEREYWQSMSVMLENRINRLRMVVRESESQ